MKIRFGITDWWTLTNIEHSIRAGTGTKEKVAVYRKEMQQKMMDGLARAIRAERNRAAMAGEPDGGQVIFELDLKLERVHIPEPKPKRHGRSMLAEFEEILNKKPAADLLEWD